MDKEQFDGFLGGAVHLPRDVQIVRLAAARATEIAAMTYSIENPQQSKLVFQKLPVHMRRRVMSHNARRMPRRLREAHLHQMLKSGLPPKSKRPSRKYRRRPKNLLEEYNRRKRRCQWLETHLWHAKRFRMVEKWGYKIGGSPNDKSFRACYRAGAEHCLLQDLSYYDCLELRGPENILKRTLAQHCAPGSLTFGAKIYDRGSREGKLVFFKKNGYPRCAMGNINFIWKAGGEKSRTIWLWIHPLVYEDISKEIMESFGFTVSNETGKTEAAEKYFETYRNGENCSMRNLRDSLNRFRLTGPLALAVLTEALRVPIFSPENACENAMETDSGNSENLWFETFYRNKENLRSLDVQRESMKILRLLESPNQLPPKCVLPITVLDPRFFLPDKRTKALADGRFHCRYLGNETLRCSTGQSPLWDPEMRKLVKESYRSNNHIDKLRSGNLVPGVGNDCEFNEKVISKVPLILLQNPGSNGRHKSFGFTCGIDVIIPAGWSMAFWQSFVLRGARAGGLGESRSLAFERLEIDSPEIHQPDVPSHAKEALATKTELRKKYFRYPPNRRINFTKFSISSPFYCEWKMLGKEWSSDSEKIYVLRDRRLLEILEKTFSPKGIRGQEKMANSTNVKAARIDRKIFPDTNCLVPVKITIQGKGRPKNFALICLPTSQDLNNYETTKNWSGPVQKFVRDPNESERKRLRKDWKILLKRSSKRRYRLRKMAQEAAEVLKLKKRTIKARKVLVEENAAAKIEYREKMEELYLPKCQKVRYSCDRQVMGYVTRGDFSFSEARGIGMGYVTLESLRNILESRRHFVLVRNTQTRQYRFARIEVLNPHG